MVSFLTQKLITLLLAFIAIVSLTFFLLHTLPGDPFTSDQALTEEVFKALHAYYGLDQPLSTQYIEFWLNLFKGDLGPSLHYTGKTVNQVLVGALIPSMLIGLESTFFTLVSAFTLGGLPYFYKKRWQQAFFAIVPIAIISLPNFVLGPILQFLFSIKWGIFPIAGWGSFSQTLLPVFTLSAFPIAYLSRLLHINISETIQKKYILRVRASGFSSSKIFFSHVLKNAVLPIIPYLGPMIVTIFTGSFAVEKVFGIPGIGLLLVQSIGNRDYPVVLGITLTYSFFLLVTLFICDLLYCFLNPYMHWSSQRD